MCTFYTKYLVGKNKGITFASDLHNERVENLKT